MLIKHVKSFLWRVAKCLSYIEDARYLRVKLVMVPIKAKFLVEHRVVLGVAASWHVLRYKMEEVVSR